MEDNRTLFGRGGSLLSSKVKNLGSLGCTTSDALLAEGVTDVGDAVLVSLAELCGDLACFVASLDNILAVTLRLRLRMTRATLDCDRGASLEDGFGEGPKFDLRGPREVEV